MGRCGIRVESMIWSPMNVGLWAIRVHTAPVVLKLVWFGLDRARHENTRYTPLTPPHAYKDPPNLQQRAGHKRAPLAVRSGTAVYVSGELAVGWSAGAMRVWVEGGAGAVGLPGWRRAPRWEWP